MATRQKTIYFGSHSRVDVKATSGGVDTVVELIDGDNKSGPLRYQRR